MNDQLNETVREIDARPERCPWCGKRRMFSSHAPRAHPDKYEEWKENHKRVTEQITYWKEE